MRKRPNDVEKLDKISQSINSDGQGNLTVSKNLGVDGKLKLKSLVSESNPDGDITKELGGGGGSIQLYHHHIYLNYNESSDYYGYAYFDYDSTNAEQFTADTLITDMAGKAVLCSGNFYLSSNKKPVDITGINNKLRVRFHHTRGTSPVVYNLAKDRIEIQDQVYLIN